MRHVLGVAVALVLSSMPALAMSIDAQVRLLGGFQPRAADMSDPAVQAIVSSPGWKKASETNSLNAVLREQASLPRLIGDRRRQWIDDSPHRTLFSPKSRALMTDFFSKNLGPSREETKSLLYLFSGPDVLYPNLLFPNLEHTVQVGLERPGQVFSPENLAASKKLVPMMGRIATAYNALMRLSYYITSAMNSDLSEFGTSTMIAVGLAANDFEILAVEPVSVDSTGQIVAATDRSLGVRVRFRKPGGQEGDVLYFRMDLSDANLNRNPDFKAFLQGGKFDTAYYKAASFVSSGHPFDGLNRLVIGAVKHIVQNDDGLPLRAFKETAPSWKLRLFGHYTRPHRLFEAAPQGDLKALNAAALCKVATADDKDLWLKLWKDACRGSLAYDFASVDWIGPVPFRYGYGAVGGPNVTPNPDRFSTLMVFDKN